MKDEKIKKEERPLHCGEPVQKNVYHRAVNSGAKWYCNKCNSHLSPDLKIIRPNLYN